MLLDFLHSQLLCILSPCLQSKTIFFAFLSPTSGLHFSCKYPTPASDPAHPAFAIPSPEHLPRCSYPEHHGLRLTLPLQYSFFPMVTPPQIVALEQIQLPLPMWIGFAYSRSWKPSGYCCGRRSSGRNGWNHFFQQTLLSFFSSTAVCG